ncbi:hypothetical protein DFP72DRAFT_898202 [Ephemerocybe angulata]|uniref:Uncharacterized protein n=1 Tax=Ephemerocybe angulata TaxID=980116 RepID=A0A8H6M8E7_9AGAR|nr:hypothetical protein DFP72DRAFT_898202 [Tulosesus angulatus]
MTMVFAAAMASASPFTANSVAFFFPFAISRWSWKHAWMAMITAMMLIHGGVMLVAPKSTRMTMLRTTRQWRRRVSTVLVPGTEMTG